MVLVGVGGWMGLQLSMSWLSSFNSLWTFNTQVVLAGTVLLGAACGVIGTLAVLRKRALMGDAIAHAALPGVAGAFFITQSRELPVLMVGALVFGLLASVFVTLVKRHTRIKEDAALALVIGGFFGLGIALSRMLQNTPTGTQAGLDSFLFGKAASMVSSDATLIAIVAGVIVVTAFTLHKEFKLLCFDRDFAASLGWPVTLLDLLLVSLICVCTVVGLPAVGVVLMVAFMVIPALAGRFWSDRLGVTMCIAGVIGGLAGAMGTILSATVASPAGSESRGWPTGPVIVLCAAGLFAMSMLFAPKYGVVSQQIRRWRLRRSIAMQNLLRDAFEKLEPGGKLDLPWSLDDLARHALSPKDAAHANQQTHQVGLRRGLALNLIRPCPQRDGQYILTSEGVLEARRVVRAHRLWELYLIHSAAIASDHVDRDADEIEHLLPEGVLAELERKLAADDGRYGVPLSPHPIARSAEGAR
jgi:manganese/zinc/iron transport system permease protein